MVGVQVVHLHHCFIDVHQLLQLQLLALVCELAELQTAGEIGLQLDESLQNLLVWLVLLSQAVVFVLSFKRSGKMYLPSRAEDQVWVCIVYIREGPIPTQQGLAQFLLLLLPVLQNVLANLARILAVELEFLEKESLQVILSISGEKGANNGWLGSMLSGIFISAVQHLLEHV